MSRKSRTFRNGGKIVEAVLIEKGHDFLKPLYDIVVTEVMSNEYRD